MSNSQMIILFSVEQVNQVKPNDFIYISKYFVTT